MAKYEPLGDYLREQTSRGETTVHLSFYEVAQLVGGLPTSAGKHRPWWANGTQPQAAAWLGAFWHVEAVSLAERFVVFTRGPSERVRSRPPPAGNLSDLPVAELVEGRILFQWRDAGRLRLDQAARPVFPPLPGLAGLYRMNFIPIAGTTSVPTCYIGETIDLQRRLSGNYRNPGVAQQTNIRINGRLVEHLGNGGVATVWVCPTAEIIEASGGVRHHLDLSTKLNRLYAEAAALVSVKVGGGWEVENL